MSRERHDRGGTYYTRSRRGGRGRGYVGRGPHAELAAKADRIAQTCAEEEQCLALIQRALRRSSCLRAADARE